MHTGPDQTATNEKFTPPSHHSRVSTVSERVLVVITEIY